MSHADEVTASYRRAEQRLRRMLLGDGITEPGIAKGEESRVRVTTALRHMREALAAALDEETGRAEAAEARATELQEELLRLASRAATAPPESSRLLTPAEVAEELDVSIASVYRAVKRNEIAAIRPQDGRRSGLRIAASEVARLRANAR